ncbi:diacylglycerol kinase family protein [Paraglaciecola aquimarina]|uniref:Diacylglycerol kinase family protein n=1 Tax=Paraglaciecola aquimarina TaxID=1235557 RepID=A0ABU3SSH8_9ALTE|nr:diacylglycerol kinase family protein [Paraglaciecola aquimarina]MDU0352976.1 diacylglycerol kinase family protein [Paraglaciecola aquimarina]
MHIAYLYCLVAVLALLCGYTASISYFSIIFYWISSSFFLVFIAYMLEAPSIFRKKRDGTIPFYIRWLFVPFLFAVQLYNSWARKNDKVPAIQKIDHNLYLACRLFPSDMDTLQNRKVGAILDVTAEFDGLDWSANNEELSYLNVPVLDHQSPSPSQLLECVNWIENHLANNTGVVVHCALGRGRSVLVMAAFLLSKNQHWTVSDALQAIQGIRSSAGLNTSQLRMLAKTHEQGLLAQKSSIALIANPVSGGGKWPANKKQILQHLSPHFSISVYETSKTISARELTQKAIAQGHKTIVGCGGDGTINEVASALINSRLSLGIIPLGTTNALSHVLHGTMSKVFPIDICCEAIVQGQTRTIDTAKCNDESMLLMVSLGFGQKMIESASREQKNDNGQLAYVKGLWQAVQSDEAFSIELSIDDKAPVMLDTTSLVVANSAPFSSILAQGNGAPDNTDGQLDMTCLPKSDVLGGQFTQLTKLAASGLTEDKMNETAFVCQAKKYG